MTAHPHPAFPTLARIDDILPAIEGFDEFIVAEREGYRVIDYMVTKGPETFGDVLTDSGDVLAKALIRRECRGLKFGPDGALIARPYHKFFNLGEKPETQSDQVDVSRPHEALEKLDGSMVHPAPVHGRDRLMTRMGMTDVAAQAEEFALGRSKLPYAEMWRDLRLQGLTPLYEWCSRQQRIVIDHPKERLALTGLRRLADGAYVAYPEMVRIGTQYGVPVVGAYGSDIGDLAAFVVYARGLKDAEGFVIRFRDGRMLKLKADDYVRSHKAKDGLFQEKNVLGLVIEGKDDDVLPLLPDHDRGALVAYAQAVRTGLAKTAAELADIVARKKAEFGAGNKKDFVLGFVKRELPAHLQPVAIKLWEGMAPAEAVRRPFLHNVRGEMRYAVVNRENVERLRPLWGGQTWASLFSFTPMDG